MNIVLIATIKGSINADDLRQAWIILQKKHPLLRATLELEQDLVWVTFANSEEIPVREVQASSDSSWESESLIELQTPFDTLSGKPLVRSALIHSPESVDLILSCHHCLSDGLSTAYIIRDILYCLSGQQHLVPSYEDIPVDNSMVPAEVKLPFLIRSGIFIANIVLGTVLKPMAHVDKIAMTKSKLLSWHLSKTQTAALLDICRKNKVTVHTAIATIFQAAQFSIQGDKKSFFKKIYTPINIRSRLRPQVGENFGLFASESYIPCKYDPKKSFWENAGIFQDSITKYTTDSRTLRLLLAVNSIKPDLIDRFSIYLFKKLPLQFGYIISNLGKLNIPAQYENLHLTAIHGPVLYIPCAEKTLTILTFNNRMFLTITYQPTIINSDTVMSIRDKAMEILEKYT